MLMGTLSVEWRAVMKSIRFFGLSWGRACGGSTGTTFNIMWNIFTMILWNPLGLSHSSTFSASFRCIIWVINCLPLRIRVICMTNLIGESDIAISLKIRSASQLSMAYQHPFRIKWRTNIWTIVHCPTKNGVAFCPYYRLKTTGIGTLTKSKNFLAWRLW